MVDLDERLAAYARHLDERMERAEIPTDPRAEVRALVDVRPVVPHPTTAPSSSQRVWLASAAAIVLLLAGSLVWWRSSGDLTGTTDTTAAPSASDPERSAVDATDEPLQWRETDYPGGFSAPLAAVPFKGGLVAVNGDGPFKPMSWRSPDGQQWEGQVEMSDAGNVRALATDGSVVVAAGVGVTSGRSWVSSDGVTWDTQDIVDAAEIRSVAHTPHGFVAVGSSLVRADGTPARDYLPGDGSAAVDPVPAAWRSADGVAWERLVLPDDLTGAFVAVASSADTVVLVGSSIASPYVVASAAGGDWRTIEVVDSGRQLLFRLPTDITWTGDRFIVVGGTTSIPLIWESRDGLRFTEVPSGELSHHRDVIEGLLQVAAVDDTVLVIPGLSAGDHDMGPWLWASTDGGPWNPASPIDVFPVPMSGVTAEDGRVIAVATDGGVWVGSPAR